MQKTTQTATKPTTAPKPQTVKRKIGKTTYELSLHFSQTSTERMSDKCKTNDGRSNGSFYDKALKS